MSLETAITKVRQRIDQAAEQAGRAGQSVKLELAVKTRTPDTCAQAARILADQGLPVLLGHNHVQEAQATAEAIRRAAPGAQIHMIGHLQSNKISAALEASDLFETVDSLKLVERIERRLVTNYPGRTLPVFLEVNCSGEAAKQGVAPQKAGALAKRILESEVLELKGLMTIGALSPDPEKVTRSFRRLKELRTEINQWDLPGAQAVRELSMGMSADLELAVAQGATIVRIGTDVFGARQAKS